MCFYNDDFDWTASVYEKTDVVLTEPTRCFECNRMMKIGELVHHIFQQEHEECHLCEEGDCECCVGLDEPNCRCEEPDFGETFECDMCQECEKFLKAVEEHEKEEGCPPGERRPAYGQLFESIDQFDRKEALRYVRKASRMFPELKRSGYLKRIWGLMFKRELV